MFCHNCGKQIPDNTKFCRYCGAAQEENRSASTSAPPQPSPPPVQETVPQHNIPDRDSGQQTAGTSPKPKKTPIWVRILLIILAVLLGRSIGQLMAKSWNSSSNDSGSSSYDAYSPGFSSTSSSSDTVGSTDYTSGSTGDTAYTPGSTGTADDSDDFTVYFNNSGILNDYYVEICSAETAVNSVDRPVLIVKYGFTNYSEENCKFSEKFLLEAHQDGELLSGSVSSVSQNGETLHEDWYTVFSQEVPPGESIEVLRIYQLNNTVSDVLVEAKEYVIVLFPGEKQHIVRKTFTFE